MKRFKELFFSGTAAGPPRWVAGAIFAMVLAAGSLSVWLAQGTSYNSTTVCNDGKNYYFPMARSLWNEGVPLDIWGNFCTHQPPLFPAVLAPALALGDRWGLAEKTVAQAINIFFACLSAVGVYVLAARYASWLLAMLVGIGFGLYPPFLWLCRDAYNEPLFTCLLVWGLVCTFNGDEGAKRWGVAGGATLLAMTTLTRAIGLPVIGIVLAASLARRRRSWGECARLWGPGLIIFSLLVGGWSCIISMRSHRASLVTTSLNGSHVDGLISGPEGSATVRRAKLYFQQHPADWRHIIEFHREAIGANPTDYLLLFGRKVLLPWYATESRQGQSVLLMINLPFLALAAGGLWVLARSWKRLAPELVALLGLLAYFWAMDVFVWSTLRYLVPIFWIMLLLDALFIGHVFLGWQQDGLWKLSPAQKKAALKS